MRHVVQFIVVVLLLTTPAAAQDLAIPFGADGARSTVEGSTLPEPQPIHVSDYLSKRPEAQASLREFHSRKETGRLPTAAARTRALRLGDTRTFKAFNFRTSEREEIEFTLRVIDARFRIWIETVELGAVSSDDLERLRRALAEQTPRGSIDPNRGILANSEAIFGDPPNVDGDGRVDVLLLDIRDHFHPEDRPRFIAGFVDPADLSNRGNNRDVMYLDLRPGLLLPGDISRGIQHLAATAAHEYQHLIHMNYDLREMTFVNEGLSEWGEIVNGYPRRPMSYLSHSDTYNIELLRWRPRGTAAVLNDYERAGLLTTYLSERLGVETTGSITQDPDVGTRGYRNAANRENKHFPELLLDFHVANFINDDQAGHGLGYRTEGFQTVRAEPAQRTDGRTAAGYSGRAPLQPGGVQYLKWNFVDEFSIEIDGASPLRARVILFQDGMVSTQPVNIGMEESFFGSYDRIVLVLAHTDPDTDPLTAHFEASWTTEQFFQAETLAYDNDAVDRYVRGRGMELLTRFTNPFLGEGFLASVQLPVYYLSQFSGEDVPLPETPRAFTFVIREVTADGVPGDELFTLTKEEERPFARVSGQVLQLLEIDLTDHTDALRFLPENVYIGFRDVAANIENQVVFPTAIHETENVSYVGTAGDWQRLWDFVIEQEDEEDLFFTNTAIPIRATYFTPTDEPAFLEDDPLPPQITLLPNAPNPFTSTSNISYTLPRDMPARLEVYDVLGRRIELLREGGQLAGEHHVTLNARVWGSGVYVVTLTAEGERVSRKVVVVR